MTRTEPPAESMTAQDIQSSASTSTRQTVFSQATENAQKRFGSYQALRQKTFRSSIDQPLADFIAERDSFYLATSSANGQPYLQHRGGAVGFLRVLDSSTLGFADLKGNRQYITTGNLSENPKCCLFLMDYEERHRVKIWGEARMVDDDPALLDRLRVDSYAGHPLQAFIMHVTAWDSNCAAHIPIKIPVQAMAARIAALEARIAGLEKDNFDLYARCRALENEG
ncbi:pyridoxamine 5'-phosphate oxidase family protein [Granulibacter bethesdensis]|uniref:Pyridoxamine 5'-phosphate oxidase family protein n=2 Tax=Granulibacter bethesdensis TaxID=364410 RepID=Q0BTW6_GRABC|nr:pyridoxamine 5'-phosphate oxidase family protein [Granulibacter bethesdensis]ABI61736.1 Pyridoxamine 5'-phosphate oxidase family protein [Granulibacter bethesdensis CGDNIH1]APH51544.1 Pyridoxamine 5'-phosphate oxidase family protein [Granulibacter bethesdensis]APH64237.1 Pyridoxamine 5'-phosphate oxidase family protein [Granulibacter bethesdensis]